MLLRSCPRHICLAALSDVLLLIIVLSEGEIVHPELALFDRLELATLVLHAVHILCLGEDFVNYLVTLLYVH